MCDSANIVNHYPGQGSTSKKTASANPPAQKPAAYRPPHAKNAATVQAEVFSDNYGYLTMMA